MIDAKILLEIEQKLIKSGLCTGIIPLNEIDKYLKVLVSGTREEFWIDTETKEIIKDKSLLNMLNMTCV